METTVYRYFNSEGRLLYVGVTKNQFARLESHREIQEWWPEVYSATFEHFPSRQEALTYEDYVIGAEFPKYNKAGAVLPPENRQHLLEIISQELDDDYHRLISAKVSNEMANLAKFSKLPESYKLLFAFDRSTPWDEDGTERLVECLNCQKVFDSGWFKKLYEEVDSRIVDEYIRSYESENL